MLELKHYENETSKVDTLLIVFISLAIVVQYFLLFYSVEPSPSVLFPSLLKSVLIATVFASVLWLLRRHLRSIQFCMAIISIAFGGLGMVIGHVLASLFHLFQGHLSHEQVSQGIAHHEANSGLLIYLVHYLPMVFLCFASCLVIGRYYRHLWLPILCHWRCHILALPWMVIGMLFAQALFIWVGVEPNEKNGIGIHVFSSLGMGFGSAGYYYWRCKVVIESQGTVERSV